MSNQDFDFGGDPSAPPGDDTVAWIRKQQQAALVNAWPSPDDDPERAGRAMDLSKATGAPASVIYANQDDFEQQHKSALTSHLLRNNKFLMDYAANPMAAKVSGDDWGQLDAVSEALGPFGQSAKSILQKGAEGFKEFWGQPGWGGWLPTAGDDYRLAWSIASAAGIPFEVYAKVMGGTLGGAAGMFGEIGKQMGYPNAPERLNEMAQAAMDPAMWASMGPIGELIGLPFEAAGYNAKLAAAFKQAQDLTRKVEPYARTGEVPPVGLDPLIDKVHAEQAKQDAKALDEVFKEAQKASTRERSPELFQDFIRQHTDQTIGISAESIQELYGDGLPEVGDNKLGWIPNIQEQYDVALATGGDVRVPLADWLAKVDPDTADVLHDGLRLRRGGMTIEESKRPEPPKLYKPGPEWEEVPKGAAIQLHDEKTGEPLGVETKTYLDGKTIARSTVGAKVEEAPKPEEGEALAPMPTVLDTVREASGLAPRGMISGKVSPVLAPEGVIPEKSLLGQTATLRDMTVPTDATFPLKEGLAKIKTDRLNDFQKSLTDFLSRSLSELVGDVKVHAIPDEHFDTLSKAVFGDTEYAGLYDHQSDQIMVRTRYLMGDEGHNYAAGMLLHEGAHALTLDYLRSKPEVAKIFDGMRRETEAALKKAKEDKLLNNQMIKYYLSHHEEFIAGGYEHGGFREILSAIPISEDLAKRVNLSVKGNTMWDAFRQLMKDIFYWTTGFKAENSMLDAFLKMQEHFERPGETLREGYPVNQSILGAKKPEQLELPEITRLEDRALFARATAIGMNKVQLAKYMDLIKKRNEEDAKFHQEQALKDERLHQTQEWKDNIKDVRKEVRESLGQRPDLAADKFLREGVYQGEKLATRTRLQKDAIPPELAAKIPDDLLGARGVHPDDLAGLFGYHSGEQLVAALGRLEEERQLEGLTPDAHFSRLVAAETDREMKNRYGDLEQNILGEAKEHIISQTQLDMIHEEVLAMAAKAGSELPITKEQLVSQVKEKFNQLPVGYHTTQGYLTAAAKAEKDIQAGLLDGKALDAFKAYQLKYLNLLFANEAKKLEKDLARFDKFAKRNSKREPSGRPPEYTNWIHDILMRTGNQVRRSVQDLETAKGLADHATLEEFVRAKNQKAAIWGDDDLQADGFETMPVAPFLFDPDYRKPIEKMNPDEFRAVWNSLKTIDKNGREERTFLKGQERVELETQIAASRDALAQAADNKQISYPLGEEKKSLARWVAAGVLQIETLFNRIDFGNPFGLFQESYFRPLVEAINDKARREKEYAAEWKALGNYGDMKKQISNPLIKNPLTGVAEPITRRTMLAILQNLGNPGNLDKLLRGYEIPEDLHPHFMQWVFANTTKEDWDRAQALGNIWKKLFSEAETVYHGITGVAPERIELKPIETPYGTYEGWYHPIIYDPRYPGKSKKLMGPSPLEDGSFFRAISPSGYTKSRTGYAAPILLNFDAVPSRMKQVINDISMRQAVTEVAKVFYDSEFQRALTKHFGKEYTDMLIPWLRDVAGQARGRDAAQVQAESLLSFFRQNAVAMLIGLNPGTVMKHGPTAAMNSIREVGSATRFFKEVPGAVRYAAEVMNLLTRDPERAERDWAFALQGGKVEGKEWAGSEELQRRSRNWIETFKGTEQDLFKKHGKFMTLREWVIQAGSYPVAMSDLLSAVPTWLAVYKDAIASGLDHGDSVYAADRSVRRAHGSSAVTSRSRIQRGGEVAQLVTPFYTFFNTMLQRQYDLTWQAKEALKGRQYPYEMSGPGEVTLDPSEYHEPGRPQIDYKGTSEYKSGLKQVSNQLSGLWAYVIFPAIIEEMVSPYTNDEHESWGLKAGKMLGRELASSWPIVRDVVEAIMRGRDPSIGMYSTAAKSVVDSLRDLKKPQPLGRNHMGKFFKHSIALMGASTGLTNAQEGRTAEFMYNYATGQDRPHGLKELWHGIRHGRTKEPTR